MVKRRPEVGEKVNIDRLTPASLVVDVVKQCSRELGGKSDKHFAGQAMIVFPTAISISVGAKDVRKRLTIPSIGKAASYAEGGMNPEPSSSTGATDTHRDSAPGRLKLRENFLARLALSNAIE
jgi:hypothetical protein